MPKLKEQLKNQNQPPMMNNQNQDIVIIDPDDQERESEHQQMNDLKEHIVETNKSGMNLNQLFVKPKQKQSIKPTIVKKIKIIDKPLKNAKTTKKGRKPKTINTSISKEKQTIIYRIMKYQDNKRFKEIVKGLGIKYNYDQLCKKSIENLKDILERIRINIDNRNLDDFYNLILKNTSLTFESVVSNFYDIDGFQEMLMNDEQFLDTWEKFKIENELPNVPPSIQMLMIVSRCMITCNLQNKYLKENPQTTMAPPSTPKILTEESKNDSDIGLL